MSHAQELTPEPDATPADPTPERPWEAGISEATRAQALELFGAANDHFAESEYAEAARGYRAALEVWDHPRIHGNLATVLTFLDAPMDALNHLRSALQYGELPFTAHVYQQLLSHRRLLDQQLARVTVRCPDEGVQIRIDGDGLFTCPAGGTAVLPAGNHELVARRAGYLTFTEAFTSIGGAETVIEIELTPLADAARYERYWSEWIPWTVFGSGLAVGALGILPLVAAIDARDQYEAEIEQSCSSGCATSEIAPSVASLSDWTERWNAVAWSAFIAAGATTVVGVVMLILNQERRIDVDESGDTLTSVPLLGPTFAGIALRGSLE